MTKAGKAHRVFCLRNIKLSFQEDIKRANKSQLQDDIIAGEFDIGIVSGSHVISLRSQADLHELSTEIQMGKNPVLWCNGLKKKSCETAAASVTENKKRKRGNSCVKSSESTTDFAKLPQKKKSRQEEKEELVESTIKKLKEKHGTRFTPMQVRIWSEMITGDLYVSLDDPPKTSMFARAGGEGSSAGIKKVIATR